MSNISLRLMDMNERDSKQLEQTIDYRLNVSQKLLQTLITKSNSTNIIDPYVSITSSTGSNESRDESTHHIDSYVVCYNRSHLAFSYGQQLSLQVSIELILN